MKALFLIVLACASFCSCMSVKEIGRLNMISTRNVNPELEYKVITTYSGGSQKELKKSKAETIQDAMEQTVRKVPGGEFLMNVKIFQINNKYFAAEGDVWGVESNLAYRGFKVGDRVVWKTITGVKEGTIKSLKDDETCFVEIEDGRITEKKYDSISKAE